MELLVNFLDEHEEIDLAAYRDILFYEDGTKKERPVYKRKFYKGTGIYDVDKDDYFTAHQNMQIIFRNNKKHYYKPSLVYGEDEYFNTETIMDKKKIGYVYYAIHYYIKHNSSITSSNNKRDFDKIYDDYYEGLMKKYNNHPLIQTLIVHNVNWRMNEGFLKEKDLVNIIKNLKKSRFFIIW